MRRKRIPSILNSIRQCLRSKSPPTSSRRPFKIRKTNAPQVAGLLSRMNVTAKRARRNLPTTPAKNWTRLATTVKSAPTNLPKSRANVCRTVLKLSAKEWKNLPKKLALDFRTLKLNAKKISVRSKQFQHAKDLSRRTRQFPTKTSANEFKKTNVLCAGGRRNLPTPLANAIKLNANVLKLNVNVLKLNANARKDSRKNISFRKIKLGRLNARSRTEFG